MDSIWLSSEVINVSAAEIEVTVHASNSVPIKELVIPINYSGDLNIRLLSANQISCRSENFEDPVLTHLDLFNKRATYTVGPRVSGSPLFTDAGSGPILKLLFKVTNPVVGQSSVINIAEYSGYEVSFSALAFDLYTSIYI